MSYLATIAALSVFPAKLAFPVTTLDDVIISPEPDVARRVVVAAVTLGDVTSIPCETRLSIEASGMFTVSPAKPGEVSWLIFY